MKILSSLILMTIVIVSCQKEVSNELNGSQGNGNNNPPANDSALLWKYIRVDTTLPPGSDTIFQDIFSYDNQKRLTHLHAVVFSTVEDDDLIYSGNDTLPYKTTGVWANALDTYYDTVFYFYSNGFVAKDSTIEYVGAAKQFSQIATRVYSPAGNNVMLEYRHYSQPTALAADADKRLMIFTTWQNGNIAVQDDTSILIKFSYAAHEEVKYDDKINPLSQTFRTRYPVLGFSFGSQTNNPVEDITWDNPSQPSRLTYSYTYRADGYPLSAKIFDDALGGEYLKVIYVYTK